MSAKVQLLCDDQPFDAFAVSNRKRCSTVGAQGRMAAAGSGLDVLGIDVASAEDDDVLEPSGDEELAAPKHAEIAGA